MSTTKYYYLKWTAVILMFADHTAYFLKGSVDDSTYLALRIIGRLSFPLFAFLLVESFHFTKNKLKHLIKIAALASVSEIPYNLFITGKLNDFRYQNVCFTLALGFLMMCINNSDTDRFLKKHIKSMKFRKFITACVRTDITALFCLAAYLLRTDYSAEGILLIALFDTAKRSGHKKLWQSAAILIFICLQDNIIYLICLADLVLIFNIYSKSETALPFSRFITGKVSKTICAVFYPAHLALFALLMI
ncbi:MAG: conjugal transfer protein TraX [Lachnospiraceae bacterium]|nr:conjugal transfer protein TraX [Lachnospiraceae bacterium]